MAACALWVLLGGCQTTQGQTLPPLENDPPARPPVYRLRWTAVRAKDNAPILARSFVVRAGRTTSVRTESRSPTEDLPAINALGASVGGLPRRGYVELKTLASVREATRTKKGKLKIVKRNIGALVPIRPGDTQVVSSANDPIRLEVRLDYSDAPLESEAAGLRK